MNIYYICPDLPNPSGGVKRIYQHVEILRSEGYPAYILHFKAGFKISWFTNDVPVRYMHDQIQWNPTDILVFPEGIPAIIKKFQSTPFRKIVIALSHSYIFPQLPFGENWKDYGVDTVLTPSKTIMEFVKNTMGIENIFLFKTSIDHSVFNDDSKNKILQIAYISRKDGTAEIIEKIMKLKNILIDFVKIENKSISEYAEILKKSSIFLTTTYHEGIHRSVIEAMACGCICVGYDAIGAKEYIVAAGEKQNFVHVENMNYIELVNKLEATAQLIKNNSPDITKIRENAIKTAAGFSSEGEKQSILEFWKEFL